MPPSFIYPKPEVECEHCLSGNEVEFHPELGWCHYGELSCSYSPYWIENIFGTEIAYKALLSEGWRPQEARSVLPNALASKIWMTGNLRNWRHFFLMRTTKEAHPQMRQVTIPLLAEFQRVVPVLYEDIWPGASQIENARKAR